MAAKHEGIEERHKPKCRSRSGGRCSCEPSFRASVWAPRERKLIRKTFPTPAAARAWRTDALVALRQGTLRAPVPTTLREAAAEWQAGARSGLVRDRSGRPFKPSTLRSYDKALRIRVLPALGDYRLTDLRRTDVQALVDRLAAQGLAASTIRNTLDPLRAIYRRAAARELVGINPTSGLEVPASRGKRDRIAAPAEAASLLAAVPADDRALWATAFYAGLRRGELWGLRWSAVDLGRSEIRVECSWDAVEGAIDPKSEMSTRTLPLIGALRDHLDQHKLATGRGDDELCFGRTATEPFVASTVRNRARSAWKAAGLQPITLHECRHTFASLLIAAGENPKAIQEFMGHSTIQMTFDRYGHLMPGSREQARVRLNAYLEQATAAAPPAT